MLPVVDLVQHEPTSTEPRAVDPREFVCQGLPDPLRIFKQRAVDELNRSCCDLVGEPIGERKVSGSDLISSVSRTAR